MDRWGAKRIDRELRNRRGGPESDRQLLRKRFETLRKREASAKALESYRAESVGAEAARTGSQPLTPERSARIKADNQRRRLARVPARQVVKPNQIAKVQSRARKRGDRLVEKHNAAAQEFGRENTARRARMGAHKRARHATQARWGQRLQRLADEIDNGYTPTRCDDMMARRSKPGGPAYQAWLRSEREQRDVAMGAPMPTALNWRPWASSYWGDDADHKAATQAYQDKLHAIEVDHGDHEGLIQHFTPKLVERFKAAEDAYKAATGKLVPLS